MDQTDTTGLEQLLLKLSGGEPVATSYEMKLLTDRFLRGLSLQEAAKVYSLTRERMRQKENLIIQKILDRIRKVHA